MDLCYNYTVEDSISGVTYHYNQDEQNSFAADFTNRLSHYWRSYQRGSHKFHKGDVEEDEVKTWIREGKITEGYSLAAYAYYCANFECVSGDGEDCGIDEV